MSRDQFENQLRDALHREGRMLDGGIDDPAGEVRRRAHRQARRQRVTAGTVAVAVLAVLGGLAMPGPDTPDVVVGPGPDGDESTVEEWPDDAPAVPTPDGDSELTNRCHNPAGGYEMRYPDGWHGNDGRATDPCRYFHPEAFTLDEGTEATDRAVVVSVADQPLHEMRDALVEGDADDVLREDERSVAGRDAVRVEVEATGEAMYPEGTRIYTHAVDADDRTILVTTTDQASDISYEDATAVHDRMVETLRLPPPDDDTPDDDGEQRELTQGCVNETDGYEIAYPQGWHANDGEVTEPCRYFHPQPFALGSDHDDDAPSDQAVAVHAPHGWSFGDYVDEVADDAQGAREIDNVERFTTNGREAVQVESQLAEPTEHAGLRMTTTVIDAGRPIVVSTNDGVAEIGYHDGVAVHERMVEALRILPRDEDDDGSFSGGTEPVEAEQDGDDGIAALTDVRMATHETFDRIVFEFADGVLPGYRIAYADPPFHHDPSGQEIDVDGESFLDVALQPASGRDAEGEAVYEGPDRVEGGTSAVTETVLTGDQHGGMGWIIGRAGSEAPFRVQTLDDPARLVVDIGT